MRVASPSLKRRPSPAIGGMTRLSPMKSLTFHPNSRSFLEHHPSQTTNGFRSMALVPSCSTSVPNSSLHLVHLAIPTDQARLLQQISSILMGTPSSMARLRHLIFKLTSSGKKKAMMMMMTKMVKSINKREKSDIVIHRPGL